MQISTRSEDFVVDTFKLWDYIGPYLREFFKDPTKKKVREVPFSTESQEYIYCNMKRIVFD